MPAAWRAAGAIGVAVDGRVASIDDDEIMGFARVVRFEGDPATGWICLEQLVGEEADQAAVDLELSYEDWCDPGDG